MNEGGETGTSIKVFPLNGSENIDQNAYRWNNPCKQSSTSIHYKDQPLNIVVG